MDPMIEKFQVKGSIYFWKYISDQRNYPGWNITADNDACNSMIELLEMMKRSEYPSRKSVKTCPSTMKQVRMATEGRYKTTELIKLHFKKEAKNAWTISETKEGLVIVFNTAKLTELKSSFRRIYMGKGDFAISDGQQGNILYFWRSE
jgi:hypothetical protein